MLFFAEIEVVPRRENDIFRVAVCDVIKEIEELMEGI